MALRHIMAVVTSIDYADWTPAGYKDAVVEVKRQLEHKQLLFVLR
jgi:hypothetical protein